jgi:hypothetical protein
MTCGATQDLGWSACILCLAITVCLTLSMVYRPRLHQTKGFLGGLVELIGLDLSVLTFSRCGAELILAMKSLDEIDDPIRLVVASRRC